MAVKVPPKGTRGVPFPRRLAAFGNRFMVRMFLRGRLGTPSGLPMLLLETQGARSGKLRQVPLGYLDEGSEAWLVIASVGGAARQPGWLYNLAKQPDATIQFRGGNRVPVRAETLEGPRLEEAWARIASDAPEFVKYRSKTDREIPVVRLARR